MNILSNAWDIANTQFNRWFYDSNLFLDSSFTIAKYAICILIGVITAYFVCTKEGERLGLKSDDVLVSVTIIVPVSIIFCRIWYVIGDGIDTFKIYRETYSLFGSIIRLMGYIIGFDEHWHFTGISGLAIHGAILAAFLGALISAKVRKWNFLSVCDMVAPGLLIGQICGRWGNFFNKEAHGGVVGGWNIMTNAVGQNILTPILSIEEQYNTLINKYHIPKFIAKNMLMSGGEEYYYGIVDGVQKYGYILTDAFYHPCFLYESLLNLLGLIIYFILRRRKFVKRGFFLGFYLVWYGLVRFFVEFARTDSLYLGSITWLKMAQLTSIIMILIGIFVFIYIYIIKKDTKKYLDVINENVIKE